MVALVGAIEGPYKSAAPFQNNDITFFEVIRLPQAVNDRKIRRHFIMREDSAVSGKVSYASGTFWNETDIFMPVTVWQLFRRDAADHRAIDVSGSTGSRQSHVVTGA
jgi:hypothetical protein